MRLVLATGIFPPDAGGPATWAAQAAPLLRARGWQVQVVTLADAPGPDDGVIRLPRAEPRGLRIPRTIALLAAQARRADLVLATGLWAEAAIAARLARRPFVARIPGDPAWERAVAAGLPLGIDPFQTAPLPPRWAAFRAARAAWTRAADRVLVPSAWLGALVQGWGVPAARITVIANAVPETGPRPHPPDHDLVWLGRMVPQKRLPALIGAARSAGASLILGGDGPCRPAPAPGLTLAGPATPDLLWRGKIYVQASSYEGLPHAVLEAKARGLAVVATDVGGTRECLRHGIDGLLVPPGDDAALEAAIAALAGDPARAAAMGAAGRADHAARFAPDAMGDALARMLAQAMAVGRQRG